jgi:prepilin-type N-terminal cleavage/methylation domain-containing protein
MMRRGFSLVELSMVLVIIGLLVGGVTVGQSLIRSSHLRAIGEEGQRYISAVANFKDQYNGLPGDILNATTYWGQAAAGAACITTVGAGTATCNGDGDALLTSNGTTSNEYMRFWQQLANAELIDGKFTGVQSSTGITSTSTANAPGSRLGPTALWAVNYWGARAGDTRMFNGSYGNSLWINGFTTNSFPFTPLINPEEAWNIDSKLDDGMPGIGNIVSVQANINTCTNMANPATVTASYLINSATPGCGIMFRNAF